MTRRLIVAVVAACSSTPPVLTTIAHEFAEPLRAETPDGTLVWVIGFAGNAKAGAIVDTGAGIVRCGDRQRWPAELESAPVVVEGRLSTVHHGTLPIGPNGERSAGLEGDERVVTPSKPPEPMDKGQLAAEHALMMAIARRDRAGIESLIAADVKLHIAGAPTLTRDALVDHLVHAPGEILAVEGEGLVSYSTTWFTIVRGVQVEKIRDAADDRTRFVDVFEERDGKWVVTAIFAS